MAADADNANMRLSTDTVLAVQQISHRIQIVAHALWRGVSKLNEPTAEDDDPIHDREPAPLQQDVADPELAPSTEDANEVRQGVDEAGVQYSGHAVGAEPEG